MYSKALLFIAGTLAVTGCGGTDVACTLISVPAIRITVKDSLTGSLYNGQATALARDGTYADSVTVSNAGGRIDLVRDRPGQYAVTIRTPDRLDWHSNVTVTKATCGINTAEVTALLQADTATSTFSVYFTGHGEFTDRNLVRVRVTADGFTLDLGGQDLSPKVFVIPTRGTATVRYSLVGPAQDTLGTRQFLLSLAPGWRFAASGYVSSTRPLGACGEPTPVALKSPTGGPTTDTLFVIVGGLPRGAIC